MADLVLVTVHPLFFTTGTLPRDQLLPRSPLDPGEVFLKIVLDAISQVFYNDHACWGELQLSLGGQPYEAGALTSTSQTSIPQIKTTP